MSKFIIEKTEEIDGQEKKLYYEGENTWTTVFGQTKKYNTTLWMSLPDKPGQLGDISSLIGSHKLNISSLEMVGKNPNYINFKFKLIIRNLKNFTNFIAELKQKSIKFKIIRHEEKRNAFTQKILKYFKKN